MNQHFQLANIFSSQGFIKTIFNNSIPIFGMLIWMRPNSIKAKVKTTKKLFFFGLKKKQKKKTKIKDITACTVYNIKQKRFVDN